MSEGPKRLQFSLKTFMLSTSFVGAGIGCFLAGWGGLETYELIWWRRIVQFVEILAVGPLLGAALLVPFRIGRVGAYLGFFAPIVAFIGIVFIRNGWETGWIILFDANRKWIAVPVIGLTVFAMTVATGSLFYQIWQRRKRQPVSENPISD